MSRSVEGSRVEVEGCDLCGSRDATFMHETRDRQHLIAGRFALVRCADCGLVRLTPRPSASDLAAFYPGEEYEPHQATGIGQEGSHRRLRSLRDALRDEALRAYGYERPAHLLARPAARVLRRSLVRRHAYRHRGFPPFVAGGRALDVGAGNGFFMAMLERDGWQVEGVDLSPDAVAVAKRIFGVDVLLGELGDAAYSPASFDFVHMSHVIEHVPSPTEVISKVAALLRPGGLLYVETPNIGSWGARHWGPLWFPLESPRHLWLFSPATLERLITEAGLHVRSLHTSVSHQLEWEATYLFEERTGTVRPARPKVTWRERPRVAAASVSSRAAWLASRRSGDILSCWATRP